MRKPPPVAPPAAPKTATKSAPKMPPKARPQTASTATLPLLTAAQAKRIPKATAPKAVPLKASPSKPKPVRVVAETPAHYFAGAGGRAWRLNSRHAVAYVRDAALAGEMLAVEPRQLAKAAMAVYYDRKGKAFAWQFRFDTARWEEVIERLG